MEKTFKKATFEMEDCLEQLEIINSTHLAIHSCIFDLSNPNSHTDYEMASHGVGVALFELTKKMRTLNERMFEELKKNESENH